MRFASFILLANMKNLSHLDTYANSIEQYGSVNFEDYELIVVVSTRSSVKSELLGSLISRKNTFVIESLGSTSEVEDAILGLSRAIGDQVFLMEADSGQIAALAKMNEQLNAGAKLVLGQAEYSKRKPFRYSIGEFIFIPLMKLLHGKSSKRISIFRALTRDYLNLTLSSPAPEFTLRYPGLADGSYVSEFRYKPGVDAMKGRGILSAYGSAMQILLGASRVPLRVASLLAFLGACLNLVYAIFVLIVAMFQKEVASGWVSTSLQLSGMFMLLSLVLLLISEYLLQILPPSRFTRIHSSKLFTKSATHSLNVMKSDDGN